VTSPSSHHHHHHHHLDTCRRRKVLIVDLRVHAIVRVLGWRLSEVLCRYRDAANAVYSCSTAVVDRGDSSMLSWHARTDGIQLPIMPRFYTASVRIYWRDPGNELEAATWAAESYLLWRDHRGWVMMRQTRDRETMATDDAWSRDVVESSWNDVDCADPALTDMISSQPAGRHRNDNTTLLTYKRVETTTKTGFVSALITYFLSTLLCLAVAFSL